MGSFFTPFLGSAINVALPSIEREFSMNALMSSWVQASYLLAAAISLLPAGKLADIYGRKKIYSIGIAVFALATLLCALARDSTSLIIFRVMQGSGGALMFSTSVAILTSVYPKEKRGRALGFVVATVYTGLALGPGLGGLLTEYLGWRSVFYINLPLSFATLFVVLRFLKGEWAEAGDEKFDFKGALLYASSLFLIMTALPKLPAANGFLLLASGTILLLLFIIYQRRARFPLLNMDLFFRNRVFAFSNVAALINYSATFSVSFLLSLYLQHVRGFKADTTGLILILQAVVMAVFSPLAGRLSDRIDARILASVGMSFTSVGLIILATFNNNTELPIILFSLFFLGFGFALFSSPNTNAIMSAVEPRFYGVASSTTSTMRMVGQMLSMGIVMMIISFMLGDKMIGVDNAHDYLMAMKIAFLVFAVLCVTGVFASLARGKGKTSKT